MVQEAHDFLSAVTASCPDDQWGYLWTLNGDGDRITTWFKPSEPIDKIVEMAARVAEGADVYFGVGTSPTKGKTNQRVKMNEASGIYALWADIDIRNPDAHKKLNLPATEEEAVELVNIGGLPPTAIVNSGHGIHAWWVFGDFWAFESDDDRNAAATLAKRWHATLRVRAAQKGWIVDSVFDLARVLRVPGTLNHKDDPATPVRLIECEPGRTYDPSDFDEHLVDEEEMRGISLPVARSYIVDGIELDPEAVVDPDKVEALRIIDERFAAAMDRNRPDFSDQSPSSYDLSLATIAAQAAWTDQEIVDLMIFCRRVHGDNLKLDNAQYYRRTVAKAHEKVGQERAHRELDEKVEELDEAKLGDDDEAKTDSRRGVFDLMSSLLGLEVTGAIRYTSDPPEFGVIIGGHLVHLGIGENVEGQARFRSKVYASDVGVAIARMKTPEWDKVRDAFRKTCVDQDVGSESTEVGAMSVWLSEYLLDRAPMDNAVEAVQSQYPYLDDVGRTCIFPKPFTRWVFTSRGERIDPRRMGRVLRQMGATTDEVTINGVVRTTRQVWVLPANFGQKRKGQSTS